MESIDWVDVDFSFDDEVKFKVEEYVCDFGVQPDLLEDLEYFQNKVWTSLAIPNSYFGISDEDLKQLTSNLNWFEGVKEKAFDRAMKVVDAY